MAARHRFGTGAESDLTEGCDALERIAQAADPRARVWRGSGETEFASVTGNRGVGHAFGRPRFHPSAWRRRRLNNAHCWNGSPCHRSAINMADSPALRLSNFELRRYQELCESAVGVGRSGPQERHTDKCLGSPDTLRRRLSVQQLEGHPFNWRIHETIKKSQCAR